jgi:hypothetical protein
MTPQEKYRRTPKGREVQKKMNKKYYDAHWDEMIAKAMRWRENNPDQYKEYQKAYLPNYWKSRPGVRKSKYAETKLFIIDSMGGQCQICGLKYDGINSCLFDVHHIGEKEIRFNSHHSREKIIEELKKCVLLCANCHRMVHHADVV